MSLSVGATSADLDKFKPYLTNAALAEERRSFAESTPGSLRLTGRIELIKFVVQRFDRESTKLTAYACIDLSKARVKDEGGVDVTPSTRENKQTTLPTFVLRDGRMKLDKDAEWPVASIC